MSNHFKDLLIKVRSLTLMLVLLAPVLTKAQTHSIVLTIPKPNPLPAPVTGNYNFQVNTPIGAGSAAVDVSTTTGQVLWDFGSTPAAPAGKSFTYQGITVTLPGDPGVPVSSAGKVTITGSPSGTLSFSFTLIVAEANDPTNSANGDFTVYIRQPMDVVLVLDKSGSMNTSAGSGTRWSALREAAKGFVSRYEQVKPQDRTSLTYFAGDALPASNCCNGLIPNTPNSPALSQKIYNELGESQFQPGGATAMGKGLKNALTKLSDESKARNIILITDGEQNVDPEVTLDGKGFSDGTTIPGGNNAGNIRIVTIGIGSPSGKFHTTLMNLALEHRGSYYVSTDGSAFTFKGGAINGDMATGFTQAFVEALSNFSPQIVEISTNNIPSNNTPVTLQTFPLNKRLDILWLEFAVGRNMERPQILQFLQGVRVEKDGASVLQYGRPVMAGNFGNTITLAFDFKNPPQGLPKLDPAGQWKVMLADSGLKVSVCKLTTIVDDHHLHMQRTLGNRSPKVNDAFPLSFKLDWLARPIMNANVQAIVVRPGDDLGDVLANHPGNVDVSNAPDAGSPGVQKYNQLWQTDSAFRNKLEGVSNTVNLAHAADGRYEGTFSGLNVSGLYRIVYRVTGTDSAGGTIQRLMIESFYTSFSNLDISKSDVTKTIQNNQLILNFRPKTSYNKFIGPAMGNAFSVTNPGIKIVNVVDHQDGRYTITFEGNVNDTTTIKLLDQPIYTGKLSEVDKTGKALPSWLWWVLLILLILLILWWLLRRKK